MKKILQNDNSRGFTLVEVLMALFLTGIISAAALQFYVSVHSNMNTQYYISDMQQNLRASLDEMTHSLRNAGANLMGGLKPVEAFDNNPDSLVIRYAELGGRVDVSEQTPLVQTSPIHVSLATNLSSFQIGMKVNLWHSSTNSGEWFTISNITADSVAGWQEIHHLGQNFASDPMPGDKVVILQELSYFIDATDTANPIFMKQINGDLPVVYAENIDDLQLSFLLSTDSTVSTLGIFDTAFVVNINMTAQTDTVDYDLSRRSNDGRRRRTLSTDVLIRNNRFR